MKKRYEKVDEKAKQKYGNLSEHSNSRGFMRELEQQLKEVQAELRKKMEERKNESSNKI